MEFLGNTPIGMLVLELLLIPLAIWLGLQIKEITKTLQQNTIAMSKQTDAVVALRSNIEKLNGSLGGVLEELHEAEIRDKEAEGRQKGMFDQLKRIEDQVKIRKRTTRLHNSDKENINVNTRIQF